eukprot:3336936-Amphidinium_carterae.2
MRFQRRMATAGMKLSEDGTFRKVEQRAPPDYETWRQAFKVLRTVLISLGAVTPARLDRYADHVHRLARIYGPTYWGAVYAADVKMRQEHFETLRRRGAALGASGSVPASEDLPAWDVATPWEWVFAASVNDRAFWHDEPDAPVLLATSQGFGHAGNSASDHAATMDVATPPVSAKRKRQSSKPQSADRYHQVDEQGNYELNRRGTPIYNKGECSGGTGPCPRNSERVHQCSKCLGNHPATRCTAQPKPPASKGKGKGKGAQASDAAGADSESATPVDGPVIPGHLVHECIHQPSLHWYRAQF